MSKIYFKIKIQDLTDSILEKSLVKNPYKSKRSIDGKKILLTFDDSDIPLEVLKMGYLPMSGEEVISDSDLQSDAPALIDNSDPKDSSGRLITRTAITEIGNHFELISFEIQLATTNGVYNCEDSNQDSGIATYQMLDSNMQITINPALAKVTEIYLQFGKNIEPIGGILSQQEPSVTDARMFITALPGLVNIPFGGGGINLSLIGIGGSLDVDAKSPKTIPYIPGTPQFRIRIFHELLNNHKFQFHLKLYTT